jgi:hypothetical protein
MTSRFPGPWRIAEYPNGFAVYDATRRQLGFFYGRTDPKMAGDGAFLMIGDARKIATDFAKLPELLKRTSGLSEAATSTQDDNSFVPEGLRSPQMLRRPSDLRSNWMKFLILIAVAALPAGYFFFGDSDSAVNVAVVPQVRTDLSAEFSPPGKAKAPLTEVTEITVESRTEPNVQTALSPTVPSDIKPTETASETKPPQALPQQEGRSFTRSPDDSTCFLSASAVLQNYPDRRPLSTLRAPGHEGTKCWYPTKRTTAQRNRRRRARFRY